MIVKIIKNSSFLLVLIVALSNQVLAQEAATAKLEFFEKEIRPLLVQHCYQCHSANSKRIEGGLTLDSRAAHLKGGDSGPAIVAGDAESSLLIEAVRYESYEMPPKGVLPKKDIEKLVRWVNMGALWPKEAPPKAGSEPSKFDLEKRKSEFWVWQPIKPTEPPSVANSAWPNNDIDRYVLKSLEQKSLTPTKDADKAALFRRMHFDLIGLPPSPEQTTAFLADSNPAAIEKTIDRLLSSSQFGERWARHWLDSVRYADSRGHEFDNDIPNAFQYRDYVIRAFNADVPYDQLVREHIAGDLLPQPRIHPKRKFDESILGTGFWFLGEASHSPVDIRKDETDRFDNMLDVMSKTFLGVTVSCARCHDHKFDAISTADYYSLSGFLQSSDCQPVRFESLQQNRGVAESIARTDKRHQKAIAELLKGHIQSLPHSNKVDHEAVLVDFGNLDPKTDHLQSGFVFGRSPRLRGQPYFRDGAQPTIKIAKVSATVSDPIWRGLVSITKGIVKDKSVLTPLDRSGRTLRSPTFELADGNVSCRVEGGGHIVACVDSHRLVFGPLHGETIVKISKNKPWVTMNLDRYVGHRLHLEFIPDKNTELSVRLIVQGLDSKQLKDLDQQLSDVDRDFEDYAAKAEAFLGDSPDASKILRKWTADRKRFAAQIVRKSHLALAMADGSSEDDHILIRGNSSKPGKVEPRHFLTAITGDSPMKISRGSGRLELANQINDPENPLTSRVIVNRIWHHLMGRGIVPTVDDFGVLGQRPTHPELLDHLATKFESNGRSIKATIKYIMLSRTYQMSSQPNKAAIAADPRNLLWHHRPPRRLQGEAIRDALVFLSGRMNPTMFGPAVPIRLTPFMEGRGRPKNNGPLDGDGRRSIYIAVRRNFLSPFMLTFDTPAPFSSMGRRNISNVPSQALALLNDPLIVRLAASWGKRAVKQFPDIGPDQPVVQQRIKWLYQSGLGRTPTEAEVKIASAFIDQQLATQNDVADVSAAWESLAQVLVNTKEFIFLR